MQEKETKNDGGGGSDITTRHEIDRTNIRESTGDYCTATGSADVCVMGVAAMASTVVCRGDGDGDGESRRDERDDEDKDEDEEMEERDCESPDEILMLLAACVDVGGTAAVIFDFNSMGMGFPSASRNGRIINCIIIFERICAVTSVS